MQYGICNLGIVPLRSGPDDKNELVSQLLYGDIFIVVETQTKWCKIRTAFDNYEGWIDCNQFLEISEEDYLNLDKSSPKIVSDLVEYVTHFDRSLIPITLGCDVQAASLMKHTRSNEISIQKPSKSALVETAVLYLNAPYLWGGKTPFGIDCSGLAQMVYKINGIKLPRDASQQVEQGEMLSFIEETRPGDLAFFDNDEGEIVHVGIIMKNNYIIHAHGKVRIDRLDHRGIVNKKNSGGYSHYLRAIKKIAN